MEDFLQGFGIFVCVGAVLLVALAVIGIRALFGGQNQRRRDVFDQQGTVRPRYDDQDIETAGGFGSSIPATGEGNRVRVFPDRDKDLADDDPEHPANIRDRDRDRDDDDEVRSRGGFGSG